MTDIQQVIDDMRPMLEDFLIQLGLHTENKPLDLPSTLDSFSVLLAENPVPEEDQAYLAARVAAFICEYLIDTGLGQRQISNGRIVIMTPIQPGVLREWDLLGLLMRASFKTARIRKAA